MRGLLLFDIDGVIRDVSGSYRRAIQETVSHFTNIRPHLREIDSLKEEGLWNNDWDASNELIKRHFEKEHIYLEKPTRESVITVFNNFYFGEESYSDCKKWTGFIKSEPLLVDKIFFKELTENDIKWGFVSGSEKSSVKYLLENRLNLNSPPLVAMEDAPGKPNPEGLIKLSRKILQSDLGINTAPIAYLGDTVADILTIKEAKKIFPQQDFISFGIAPPHLQRSNKKPERIKYEQNLELAGADKILKSTNDVLIEVNNYF